MSTRLHFYKSNRLEKLLEKLAAIVAEPLARPFDCETVLVLSRPMQHWVSLGLAKHNGICANMSFPFPLRLLNDIFAANLDVELPDPSPYDSGALAWSLVDILQSRAKDQEFRDIEFYLKEDKSGLKRYLLASRIADLLDQYTVYRPNMIQDWEQGRIEETQAWQARTWLDLVERHGAEHRATLARAFLEKFADSGEQPAGLPQRICMFGVCALPGFYLEVFQCLARFIPVHVFMLDPCKYYWGDIASKRDIAKRQLRKEKRLDTDEEHYETLNSLLASMGKLGKEFMDMVLEPEEVIEGEPLSHDPGSDTLLASIQSEILNLSMPDERRVGEDDRSVQVHCCHSPMREVEVLHDRLLDLFERCPDLEPRDVIVMAPDIESYAPGVQAIFSKESSGKQHIPYSIADRSARYASSAANAFVAILDLAEARYTSAELMAVLEIEAVHKRFGLDEQDVQTIRTWLAETRVHWGLDAEHRAGLSLPECDENTWRWAIDRMLLGYALPGEGQDRFSDVLPYDEIEGGQAEALGGLARFVSLLSGQSGTMGEERTVPEWAAFLSGILETFIHVSRDTQDEIVTVQRALRELEQNVEAAGFEGKVSLKVVRAALDQHLACSVPLRFLSYGVNFSAFVPLRSIPFRVVCLLGMNDKVFPREDHPLSFDLIAESPQPGDRSRRSDDRYLFLEAILSARDYLYISYVGKSLRDDSDIPPSVLVSELLDYVAGDDRQLRDRLVITHPLQPFSPRYFSGAEPELFSYSSGYCTASAALAGDKRVPSPLFSAPIAVPQEQELSSITIGNFRSFFRCPARFLLQRRLGIYLPGDTEELQETESFTLDPLDGYRLGAEMLRMYADGLDARGVYEIMKGRGDLPHGTPGRIAFDRVSGEAAEFMVALDRLKVDPCDDVDFDRTINGIRLSGRLGDVYAGHMLRYRWGSLRGVDELSAWIDHLFLCAFAPGSCRTTVVRGKKKNEMITFGAVDDAERKLADLVELYREGLRVPLRFFPESSMACAIAMFVDSDPADPVSDRRRAGIHAARNAWQTKGAGVQPWEIGEYDKFPNGPYYKATFGNVPVEDIFNDDFRAAAERIYEPMLAVRTSAKKSRKKRSADK